MTAFINLTAPNGSRIRINSDQIGFIGPADSSVISGANSVIQVNNINYPVQETIDEILANYATNDVEQTLAIQTATTIATTPTPTPTPISPAP